jgi:hypothetical protein
MFVVQDQMALSREGKIFLNQLKPFLVEVYEDKQWPGTILCSEKKAFIYKCQLTSLASDILKVSFQNIWDWKAPTYPEDLSFIRPNGMPWFISITHEKDTYFKLEESEKQELENLWGSDSLKLEGKDWYPDKIY